MTTTTFDVTGFSAEQLAAMQAAIAQQKKLLKEAEQNRLTSVVQPVAEAILADVAEMQSTDHWVGHKTFGVPVKVDGREFTASITLTDVAETAKKPKRTRKATKAEAEAEGIAPEPEAPKGVDLTKPGK